MLFSPSSAKRSSGASRKTLIFAAAVTATLSLVGAKPASTQDMAPCDQFAWPVKREQALFASKDLPHIASGATLDLFPDHGIALELEPHDAVPYTLPPGRPPKIANSSGGLVVISHVPKAGPYQITASAKGGSTSFRTARRSPPQPIAADAIAPMSAKASGSIFNQGPLPSRSAELSQNSSSSPSCLRSEASPPVSIPCRDQKANLSTAGRARHQTFAARWHFGGGIASNRVAGVFDCHLEVHAHVRNLAGDVRAGAIFAPISSVFSGGWIWPAACYERSRS